MSTITRKNPLVLARIPVTVMERPAFTNNEEGRPDPDTFELVGNNSAGKRIRHLATPSAWVSASVGEGTVKKPNPSYLTDPHRRYLWCLDKKPQDRSAKVVRVDQYRERNVSYGMKPREGSVPQDRDFEIEVSDNDTGDLFMVFSPTNQKTDLHAIPILTALGRLDKLSVGDTLNDGAYKISRIEGRKVFVSVHGS